MRGDRPSSRPRSAPRAVPIFPGMFVFFSNRLGCLGSIAVSVALTAAVLLGMRACGSF